MEESFGLRKHPELLKNGGKGLYRQIGSERISMCLLRHPLPALVITIDTTPLLKGSPGIALYSKHWNINTLRPSPQLLQQTQRLQKIFKDIFPQIHFYDKARNDYSKYGYCLNQDPAVTIPSVALEPAIYPDHQINENVFLDDIQNIERILVEFLERQYCVYLHSIQDLTVLGEEPVRGSSL